MEDLKYLVPFVEIVKCGSFAAAAAKLGVTPPAISKSVARLEHKLGMRLFNRTTRRLHLTSEGQMLFGKLDVLLTGVEQALENVRESAEQPTGKIRVSVGATFGRYSLIPALVEFMQQHPLLHIEVSFDDNPTSLVEKGFDVGIHHGHGTETSYVSRVLCPYPLLLVASPQYLAQRGVPKTPEDLDHHEYVDVVYPSGAMPGLRLTTAGRRQPKGGKGKIFVCHPKARLSMARQWDTNLTAALHGAGIAATSLPASMQFLRQKRLKIVLPDYRIESHSETHFGQIYILYPHREYLSTKVRVFVDFMLKHFRSERDTPEDLRAFYA